VSTREIARPEIGCEYGRDNPEIPVSKWDIIILTAEDEATKASGKNL
jgi:hypothetical protein